MVGNEKLRGEWNMNTRWLPVLAAAILMLLACAAAETSGSYEYALDEGTSQWTITRYTGTDAALTVPATLDGHTITVIGEGAFAGCYDLTAVTVSEGVTTIADGAFFACDGLTSVTLPDSLTSLAADAFHGCSSLEAIAIPRNVALPQGNPFSGCPALTQITVTGGNAALEVRDGLLYDRAHGALVCWPQGLAVGACAVPEGTLAIGPGAFFSCDAVTAVTLPDSVTAIGDDAFRYCTDMVSIRIPAGLTALGRSAFEGCSSLRAIALPRGLREIPAWLLRDCDSLTAVTVPDGVTSIAFNAFEDSDSLARVMLPASLHSVDTFAFYDCDALTDVFFGGTQAQWDALSIADFNDSLTGARLRLPGEADLDLPADVAAIESQAFADLEGSLVVRFHDHVTDIADDAFPPADSADLIFAAPAGSYAESWARSHGYYVWTVGQ